MKHAILILFINLFLSPALFSQNNDVLMTVAGEEITTEEFLNVYKKNNVKGEEMDKKALEEYLDLYINFKLKVKEAELLRLDTNASFKSELAGYRKQLAQPYLTDKSVDEELLKEAYERAQFDIRASHILVKVDVNAPPADTLAAFNKILNIRNRILKGESFESLAKELSEDPSAKDREDPGTKNIIKGNRGDLGYFSVLDMIYPFENAAYKTKVGAISMPVRTSYGYHLIKVTDRKPAMGKATVAHIYISIPKDAPETDLQKYKDKAFEAYNKIVKAGETYEKIVTEYSDDKGSAVKGGVLPSFGVNRMVPEFIEAISKLKNTGDISEPVLTNYGWHIIKLIDQKPIKSFEDEKPQLKSRILKDSRSEKSKESVVLRIKLENKFRVFPETKEDFYKVVDTTIFEGNWDIEKAKDLSRAMFSISNRVFTQADFANFLAVKQPKMAKQDIVTFINNKFDKFVDEKCLEFEDRQLEVKYPEFKNLMKEYHDGIMLFDLTDKKVWSKAISDTVGLKDYYEKNKTKYMWDQRLDASIFYCKDEKVAKSSRKLIKSLISGKITESDLLKQINIDSIPVLKIERKKYSKNDNHIIDSIPWKKGVTKNFTNKGSLVFVLVNQIVEPEPKLLKEVKGLMTADYQNYLEKEWIADLRKKYEVVVNKDVFEKILK